MNSREADRRRGIERAMRAHPAGSALRRRVESPPLPSGVTGRAPAAQRPLRLTARGRRLVAVLAVAAGIGAAAVVGSVLDGQGRSAAGLHLVGETSVVVNSGDTLWSIASSVAGDDDVRGVVDRIRQLNGLHGSDLVPGQVLRLP